MKLYYRENPRTLALVGETHTLLFAQLSSGTVEVHVEENGQLGPLRLLIKREVHGCLGLISVEGQIYVAVITGALTDVAHPVLYELVNKIYAVEFVALESDEWDFVTLDLAGMAVGEEGDTGPREVHPCFELKKLLSNGLFYFLNDFDLTSQLQKRGIDPTRRTRVNLAHYDEQYMWNLFMMDQLIRFRANLDELAMEAVDSNGFLTTVIRGFAKTIPAGRQDFFTVISKQLWKRAGTRFNARGVDDDGHVANFVETEFVYNRVLLDQVFAYTQIRGSVPAFWEQDLTLINPKITITRSRDATQPAFDRHLDDLCGKYGVVHIVNLLSNTKPQEVEVLRRYKTLLDQLPHRTDVAYSHFDFHAETKQSGFAGATRILPLLRGSLEKFGWYSFDTRHGEVVTRQDGVFRVNCLDCLDRTNLVEQVVCQCVLEHIVPNSGAELSSRHNTLWADNGDAISQIYTGTNALKLSFLRLGKMNFSGALSDVTKSVSRMYQNTFVDLKKQLTIDLLLGKDALSGKPVQIYDEIYEFVHERLRKNAHQFTSYSDVHVFVGTWNAGAASAPLRADFDQWLFPPQNDAFYPDVYAIGLQEIIELNAGSFLAADSSRPALWAKFLDQRLNSRDENYVLLRTEALASMCLFLFVKKSNLEHVTSVSGSSKKTGLGGITANKGACAVRFDYGATTFALVTSHLAAGASATLERHYDYTLILQGLLFTRNYTISDHDHIVWFGDLNYRIDLPNDRCRYLVNQGAFDELMDADQLKKEMSSRGGAFSGFDEVRLCFYPTYKFDQGTSNYDTSEKQRTPSWTDRIVYASTNKEKLSLLNYGSCMDISLSDHKPVFSTFKANVKFVDRKKKLQLTADYYREYKGDQSLSLIDFGEKTAPQKKEPPFASATLSQMNLNLVPETKPPAVPPRRLPSVNTLPRRVPPPPMNVANSPPPPPPSRKSNASPAQNHHHPIAFSTPPLVPSNSPTPKLLSPVSTASAPVKPMVPSKPLTLATSKVAEHSAPPEVAPASEPAKPKPTPPPPRTQREPGKSMGEWKPLVPQ